MAVPKLPSYPPLHLFGGAAEHANSGGGTDGGDDEDGDSLCSLNPRGEADFLFRGVPPVPLRVGDEKLGGLFSSTASETSPNGRGVTLF